MASIDINNVVSDDPVAGNESVSLTSRQRKNVNFRTDMFGDTAGG
jgi:hypothetical protein